MGICTRVLLFDEFDWQYNGFNRNAVFEQVKAVIPHAKLDVDTYQLMIFDIDKSDPGLLIGKATYDFMMIMNDGNNFLPVKIDTSEQGVMSALIHSGCGGEIVREKPYCKKCRVVEPLGIIKTKKHEHE